MGRDYISAFRQSCPLTEFEEEEEVGLESVTMAELTPW